LAHLFAAAGWMAATGISRTLRCGGAPGVSRIELETAG